MKLSNLKKLVQARSDKRQVVITTDLETGQSELLEIASDGLSGKPGLGVTPEQIDKALRNDKPQTIDTDENHSVFVNVFNPPLRLIIVGAVHIAQPLAKMAALSNFAVTIVDPREAFGNPQRFEGVDLNNEWPDEALASLQPDARTAVVTLTHDPKLDDPALDQALKSDCFYIGSLGSRKTHSARAARLQKLGWTQTDLDRIHGPVGLDIGSQSPSEIAVSILAQIIEVLRTKPVEVS